jgi:hypothetical protein
LEGAACFVAELQRAGFEYIQNEGMGPFCPPRIGLGTTQTRAEGQNSIYWWFGNEDIADGMSPMIFRFEGLDDDDAHARHFRFFANYSLLAFQTWAEPPPREVIAQLGMNETWAGTSGVRLPDYYHQLMALWPAVRDFMHLKRRLTLPDGQGVFWTGGRRSVLWSYKAFPFPLNGLNAEQLYPKKKTCTNSKLMTEPLGIYLIN